jgi:hypothetical protein
MFCLLFGSQEAKEHGIEDCRIWGSGLVALTGNFLFFAVVNFDEPYPKQLADPLLNEPPHSWVVVEPQFTLNRTVEVLVATRETVLIVDASDVQDQVFLFLFLFSFSFFFFFFFFFFL